MTCYDNGTIARVSRDGKTVATYDKDKDGGALQARTTSQRTAKAVSISRPPAPGNPARSSARSFISAKTARSPKLANDLHYANGIALGADGKRLYVNELEAGRVISFAIGDDGSLSDRRLFVRVGVVDEPSGIGAYPDGIKLGPDGNFYIGQYSKGRIVVVDKDGKFVKAIDVPSPTAPNMAFSPDGKLLYVMSVDDTANAPYWGKVYEVPLE